MGRKLYLSLVVLVLSVFAAVAQTGDIKGKITETGGKEAIPFASVAALQNGIEVLATSTDFDGNFTLKPLGPGKYDIKATSVGYQPVIKPGVIVSVDKTSFVDLELGKGVELKPIVVEEYKVPLIDVGNPATSKTLTQEEITAAPTRDVNSLVSQQAGVLQKDEGGGLNIRGSRTDGTTYFVDGQKVRGNLGLPNKGTEQITSIVGGIPAQYGDVVGGVISVTTRGPANEFGGSLELATSEKLDAFGYNLASLNLTGPILTKKDADGKKTGQSIIGFFLAGEYQYDKDPKPTSIPVYKVNDELLEDVRAHPLVASPAGGYIHRSSYFTNSDFVTQKYRENVAQDAFRFNGKLDIRPAKNVTLTFGGSMERTKSLQWVDSYTLMNFSSNPERIENNWRAFARLTQQFASDQTEKSSSVIKNAYYTIQIDYSKNNQTDQSQYHKDRLFDYGYVGKFTAYTVPQYDNVNFTITHDSISGTDSIFRNQTGVRGSLYTYEPGTQNPYTANYTSQYYDLTSPLGVTGYTDNPSNVELNGGLLNGDNRVGQNVYGIWSTTGRVASQYRIQENTQGRLTALGSADIKNHSFVIGLEYEQRVDRGYNVATNDLWTLMNLLGNQKLKDVDSSTMFYTYSSNFGIPTKYMNFLKGKYTPAKNKDGETLYSGFYENIRNSLGINMNDTIQTDSYSPDFYNTHGLDLFTPDELLNNGNPYINYFGYDYTGKEKNNGSWDLKDFYVNKDQDNNYLREIGAFRPTYIAGHIQDKFVFNDIIFSIGLRIDRFDANQKVLKDPYSLYVIHKASDNEVSSIGVNGTVVPSNIKGDYSVYVNDIQHPTKVVGYRNGSTWYDETGSVTTDLTSLTQGSGNSGGIKPFLTSQAYDDVQHTRINPDAFTDYEPQVNFMPRIAFSFPISDEAYFAAHYDVMTQRPQDNNLVRFDPIDYLNWSQGISANFANPDLKPERSTEYEINFQQKLSRSSRFSIAAFYKEQRDMIQIVSYDYAYPIKYTAYGNVDFGTVKGLTFEYDLRRSSNVRLSFSYTLSFADGTGSSATTNQGIIAAQGQTNLREIKPLDFDQRHTLVTSFDFHYDSGKEYNGPIWWNKQVFSNAGANIVFRAGSGTPYTRKSNISPEADFTTTANSRPVIAGSINGSRYPWNFKVDAKLDKSFDVRSGFDKDGNPRRAISANVYLQVLNVFDTKNVTSVYSATGSPDDDGYIDSPGAQSAINEKVNPQSYIDMYRIAVNDPDNYSLPRRIRLGIQLNF